MKQLPFWTRFLRSAKANLFSLAHPLIGLFIFAYPNCHIPLQPSVYTKKFLLLLFLILHVLVLSQTKSKSPLAHRNNRRSIHGKGGECSFCWHWTLDARGKKSDFVRCLYALAGYNGMAFTPWVTLP
ncbi:hypothetical protein AVEN_109019-1 [Araneus ventricosus]|uniref:Uncharacterized protein n=1 Tax=Araneus ventricosus TaxID=182803 RepID=A0A4Y2HN19_ARAVE|nr:hypothetical protein AVEN_109019-1 [Araneus ventricosus]